MADKYNIFPINLGTIEMCSIPNTEYVDGFLHDNDKWYKVARVGKIASYNGETITTDYLSSTGGLDTGATIYYGLTTPTQTEITNTTLKEQLSAIEEMLSYQDHTNINQYNSNMPFMLYVVASKKGSGSVEITNEGNIYSKPTIEIEGTGVVNIYKDGTQAFEIDLSEENEITIDTEHMEAYTPNNTLANRKVTGDYSKFKLDSGTSNIKFDGALTSATITNYKRWL